MTTPEPPSPGTSPPGPGADRPGVRRWHAELAWPGCGEVQADVLIEAVDGVFRAVTPGCPAGSVPPGTVRLAGLTLPGLANAHSHAFHRALRGVTEGGQGTFWSWRELMYQVAGLTPASYLELARAVYAEMALAGVTCVGEFHYVHHGPGGVPYADPNEMGRALIQAAAGAGIRITLLDTCYLAGGLTTAGARIPLAGPQLRFSDGDGDRWADRVSLLGGDAHGVIAAHARPARPSTRSGRCHPPRCTRWWPGPRAAGPRCTRICPSSRPRTPPAPPPTAPPRPRFSTGPGCSGRAARWCTPPISAARTWSCSGRAAPVPACARPRRRSWPTGSGRGRRWPRPGCPLSLGSDSHAVIDLLQEARLVELGERLRTGQRGHFTAAALAAAASGAGHACLGWPDAGEIVPGAIADLITVSLDTPRLAGARPLAGGRGGPGRPARRERREGGGRPARRRMERGRPGRAAPLRQ